MRNARIRRRIRAWLFAAMAALFVFSVPWYRAAGSDTGRLLGLPDWVGVALLCYVGVAILNAVAWLLSDIPDSEPPGDGG